MKKIRSSKRVLACVLSVMLLAGVGPLSSRVWAGSESVGSPTQVAQPVGTDGDRGSDIGAGVADPSSAQDAKIGAVEQKGVEENVKDSEAKASEENTGAKAPEGKGGAADKSAAPEDGADKTKDAGQPSMASDLPEDGEASGEDPQEGGPMAAADFDGKVYISGKGDDANDGLTAATPVKTFAKALEILNANQGDTISVVGTVQVTGTEKWAPAKQIKMVRDESFTKGSLVQATGASADAPATLEIENVILDGMNTDPAVAKGSIISAKNTRLRLGSGTVVQNGVGSSGGGVFANGTGVTYLDSGSVIQNCYATLYGGGVNANGQTMVINNATIRNCSSKNQGGGVFLNNAKMTMQGDRALIENCKSQQGGAVGALNASVITMNGGKMANCSADSQGGAVNMTGYIKQCFLYMNGGEITGNTAGTMGGGILSATCAVLISNGKITNNTAGVGGGIALACGSVSSIRSSTANQNTPGGVVEISGNHATATPTNYGEPMLSGGGIYVDGPDKNGYPECTLYMDNFLVTGNTAGIDGGGVAFCPKGNGNLHINNGSAIYGNDSKNGGDSSKPGSDDLIIIRTGTVTADGTDWSTVSSSTAPMVVSPTMLGGGAYKWQDENGNPIPLDQLKNAGEMKARTPVAEGSPEANAARAKASVFIVNNTADGIGGGIGMNGEFESGATDDLISFHVKKNWDDAGHEDQRPEKLKITVLQNGEEYGIIYLTPDENGEWEKTFESLPKFDENGEEYEYSVVEEALSPEGGKYEVAYEALGADADGQGEGEPDVNLAMMQGPDAGYTITNKFVETFKFKISKTDMNAKALAGAGFVLSTDAQGADVVKAWTSAESAEELELAAGRYYLVEKNAPQGYVALSAPVVLEVNEDGSMEFTAADADKDKIAIENGILSVKNSTVPEKPEKPGDEGPKPEQPKDGNKPNTGDDSSMAMWLALGAMAALGLAGLRKKAQR